MTKNEIGKQTARIIKSFPKMPISMIDVLKDRFIENGFNDERMTAAVNHVIDTYEGWDKLPNIANFIQFDQKIKLHTYTDFLNIIKDLSPELTKQWQSEHIYTKFNGGWFYVAKSDYDSHRYLFEV